MTSPWTDPDRGQLEVVHEEHWRDLSIKRLPGVLRNSTRIQQFFRTASGGVQELEDMIWGAYQGTTLGLSVGHALDRWGAVVGEPRGSLASDEDYRCVIWARALANRCDGTVDAMMEVMERACFPVVCIESFQLYPAGFQIQIAREAWMSEPRRRRVRRILDDIAPAGRVAVWVEAVQGGFGPAASCSAGEFTGPLAREI